MDSNQRIVNCLRWFVQGTEVPEQLEPLRYMILAYNSIHKIDGEPSGIDAVNSMFKRLEDRMKLGKERYGHGIRIEDDTRQWGTVKNSWLEMCEEEILDGIIYSISHYLRHLRSSVKEY